MKNIYLALITLVFMITFSVRGLSQTCTLPEGRIAESPIFVYDVSADSLIITVPVSNAGSSAFASPFKITVYKDNIGNAQRYTYNYNSAITAGETVDITFGIKDFKAGWTPFDSLIIRINDSGNGYNNQAVCDSANRDYERIQLIASDDRMLVFNNSTDNQFRVAINDILLSSYISLTVNLLDYPAYSGIATVSGSTIFYTPAAGQSFDTLRYRIHCGNAAYADTATVYIKIMNQPENVGDAECFMPSPATVWDINEVTTVNQIYIYNYQTPMVGDIDGDAIPEIVAMNANRNGVVIFKGNNLSTYTTFSTPTLPSTGSCLGLVRTKISATESKTLIIVSPTDGYMRAYNANGGLEWTTANVIYTSIALFGFADFNKDGYAEIYAGNKILDAATGTVLCTGTQNSGLGKLYSHDTRATVAGDFSGNGNLQLAAGNQIYEMNNSLTGMSVIKTLSPFKMEDNTTDAPTDGLTELLDLDLDGNLDIMVLKTAGVNYGTLYIYVWSPALNKVLAKKTIPNAAVSGIPLIGDIDGDGYPEILFITGIRAENFNDPNNFIHALKYIPNSNVFSIMWQLRHTDTSGCTGLTLFDFNQDNISELVYRDENVLRIINGSKTSHFTRNDTIPYDLKSIACMSGTYTEMPVVADIDNDGHAEIITTGPTSGTQWVYTGPLRVFKGNATSPWAPARRVWNQTPYNSVNVNEDLTIPTIQIHPATVFPGPDGQLGTADDIRPYNNFLQQQTLLSKSGTPYWEASDYAIDGVPNTVYHEIGDSLVISFCVKNDGDIQGTAPFYVSVYKNARQTGNAVVTKSYPNIPAIGQTICYSIKIENVLALGSSINSLHLWLNDGGTGTSANPECDYTNGVVIYDVTGTVAAQNDYASVFVCDEITIPILANDVYSGTTFEILNTPKYGTVVQAGGVLKYTNDGGTSGLSCEQTGNRTDTIRYKITSIVSEAKAYAVVKIYSEPEMFLEDACSANPKIVLSNSYNGFSYDWEYSPDGASGWTFLITNSGSTELKNITQAGFYRVTINYDNGKTYQLPKGIEVVANRTTHLPGGIVWYDLSFNTVTINWQ